jgi:hypothetical protein
LTKISWLFNDSPLQEEAQTIEVTLNQMIRLGVAIRKSGTHSRYLNADQSLDRKEHAEFERHMVFLILYGAEEHCLMTRVLSLVYQQIISPATALIVRSMVLNPARLTRIQQRIITANITRRNRFDFMKKKCRAQDALTAHSL